MPHKPIPLVLLRLFLALYNFIRRSIDEDTGGDAALLVVGLNYELGGAGPDCYGLQV
jgi:hypothetical protein